MNTIWVLVLVIGFYGSSGNSVSVNTIDGIPTEKMCQEGAKNFLSTNTGYFNEYLHTQKITSAMCVEHTLQLKVKIN